MGFSSVLNSFMCITGCNWTVDAYLSKFTWTLSFFLVSNKLQSACIFSNLQPASHKKGVNSNICDIIDRNVLIFENSCSWKSFLNFIIALKWSITKILLMITQVWLSKESMKKDSEFSFLGSRTRNFLFLVLFSLDA